MELAELKKDNDSENSKHRGKVESAKRKESERKNKLIKMQIGKIEAFSKSSKTVYQKLGSEG